MIELELINYVTYNHIQ